MTEEKKKAIEYLLEQINYFNEQIKFIETVDCDYYDEEYNLYKNRVKQFETLLNLIEKQQKIIENSVPKESIREKMKELEEEKEQLRIEKNVTWDSGIYKLDLKINILKEILGE